MKTNIHKKKKSPLAPGQQEIRSAATANAQNQNPTSPAFQLADNRPEAISQRKIQALANNSHRIKPINHPITQFALSKVTQLQFDAGNGAQWHIHKGHIKLGKVKDSRVEFHGKSKKEIKQELGDKINRYSLNVGGDLAESFNQCLKYINDYC